MKSVSSLWVGGCRWRVATIVILTILRRRRDDDELRGLWFLFLEGSGSFSLRGIDVSRQKTDVTPTRQSVNKEEAPPHGHDAVQLHDREGAGTRPGKNLKRPWRHSGPRRCHATRLSRRRACKPPITPFTTARADISEASPSLPVYSPLGDESGREAAPPYGHEEARPRGESEGNGAPL